MDIISEVKIDDNWVKAGENKLPAWCYYQNDTSNEKKLR